MMYLLLVDDTQRSLLAECGTSLPESITKTPISSFAALVAKAHLTGTVVE
jgi:hypothetical protein